MFTRRLLGSVGVAGALLLAAIVVVKATGSNQTILEWRRLELGDGRFKVEVVRTPGQLQRGLMGRPEMAADQGMLFVLPGNQPIQFWMKSTLIPLDMLWMDRNLGVIYIQESAPPCTADPCPLYGPNQTAAYVLELNGGRARQAHIQVGDRASVSEMISAGDGPTGAP